MTRTEKKLTREAPLPLPRKKELPVGPYHKKENAALHLPPMPVLQPPLAGDQNVSPCPRNVQAAVVALIVEECLRAKKPAKSAEKKPSLKERLEAAERELARQEPEPDTGDERAEQELDYSLLDEED